MRQVRTAGPEDAATITRIYNQGIAERIATFETQSRDVAAILLWFDGRHPIVVVEDEPQGVIAFASSSTYRPRACYAGIAEFSVYMAHEARGQGAGRLAMETLLEAARAASFWKLVSRVFVENLASRHLLQAVGFREVGVYEQHGQLEGVWRDVIVERLLSVHRRGADMPLEKE